MRFILVLLLPLLLLARENPFSATDKTSTKTTSSTLIQSSNTKPKIHPSRIFVTEKQSETITTEPKVHPQRKQESKQVINTAKARLVFRPYSVYIETKDRIIRHFHIVKSHSIVMDFKSPSDFASVRRTIDVKPFHKVVIGAHSNRYRVVLRLEGKHNYKIEKKKYGELITILK